MDHKGVGRSYRGGVSHKGVGGSCRGGWVMQGWGGSYWGGGSRGGVGHAKVRSGGSCRGWMGWVMKNIKILKILNYWCYRVSNSANQNQICRVLNFLNHNK